MTHSRHRWILASSTIVAIAVAAVLMLRPSRSIQLEMAAPAHLPAAARAILKERMARHGSQMGELLARLVVLDPGGAARVAGAIYDEPTLARPIAPDDLNQLLPPRFFVLQDELKIQARKVVLTAAGGDTAKLADELGALTKVCVSCHAVYLYEQPSRQNAPPRAQVN